MTINYKAFNNVNNTKKQYHEQYVLTISAKQIQHTTIEIV
jgi:hypothetical protein